MRTVESVISIKGLHKSFGGVNVLKGVDMEIQAGSIFCLLGSNGAGKTTTVRILSTLIRPDAGEIWVCGYDLRRQPDAVRSAISVTGQYAAVDDLLTGRENMHMIGRLFHADQIKGRTNALLDRFELSHAADRRVGTYSGGMRRKLDIAMSLLGSPKVLFLDEPTTGLDPQNRLAMWEEIKKLKEVGVTVFLTTQYLEEAEHLADAVVILNGGVVAACGSVAQLKGMLPGGAVALAFAPADYERALALLQGYTHHQAPAENAVTVMTDGSVDALRELLVCLSAAGVSALSAKQQEATLEEVFLTQIGKGTGVH